MARPKVRKGMPSVQLTREEFARRFRGRFEEVRNAARSLVQAVKLLRRGELKLPDASLIDPRQK